MRAIADAAEQHGLTAHRFYGTDDGEIMVVDEWPEAENFERFFQEQQDRIGPLMQNVGVTDVPLPQFWRKLETYDDVGWGA